ncbi:class I SAM-dependent methyltransferase [Chloroflexota bacterium]
MKSYFDSIYNPVYDFTTAQRTLYRRLQTKCVNKFKFHDGDRVLCAGVGTGNEVVHILKRNKKVSIVGVDYSSSALRNAGRKARELGVEIEVSTTDIRNLKFPTESFDKVLCIHVTDFIHDGEKATMEIIRVLKRGGEFVITYPSEKESSKLGINLLKDSIRQNLSTGNHLKGFLRFLAQTMIGIVYLPLLLRSKKRKYSHEELQAMFVELVTGDFHIEAYPMYQDFIVYGEK